MWTADDIAITLRHDLTEDPVVTAEIKTPDGTIWVMADLSITDNVMTLRQVHIHGHDVGSGGYGARQLRWLAQAVMEAIDVNLTIVEGASRTTGANPGRRPGPIRFQRKTVAPPGGDGRAEPSEGRDVPSQTPHEFAQGPDGAEPPD